MNTQVIYKIHNLKEDNTYETVERRGTLLGFVALERKEQNLTIVNGQMVRYGSYQSMDSYKEEVLALIATQDGSIIKVNYCNCTVVN